MPYIVGELVEYFFRRSPLVGGGDVHGTGVIVGHTLVGTNDAYVIKPDNGGECIHVLYSGVSAREYCTDYRCAGDCNGLHSR